MMPEFAIRALRAIIELIVWCMLGQGTLALLAGKNRQANVVYQFFELISRLPRQWMANITSRPPESKAVAIATFVVLLLIWFGLAILRKFV